MNPFCTFQIVTNTLAPAGGRDPPATAFPASSIFENSNNGA